ncbi:MAG: twin-arginine translocase TatA/TatE family subunit [candidate division NC10 bacterium]
MDFLSVGASEILMVVLVALLVVGPNKVVEMARTLGKVMRSVRKASSELTSAVTREMEIEDREKRPPSSAEKKD